MGLASLAYLGGACVNEAPPGKTGEGEGTTVSIVLAGDVMLGRGIDQILRHSVDPVLYEAHMRSAAGYVDLAEGKHGPIPRKAPAEYVWGDALALLTGLDSTARVRIVNLETAITGAGTPWLDKPILYRMHPANVDVLQAAGIQVATLANNHSLDWGSEGLSETLATLERAGIGTAGAGIDSAAAAAPAIIPVPDGRVVVFAVADPSSGVPIGWGALSHRAGVHLLPDLSRKSALALASRMRSRRREPGDRVVLSIHWGGNWGNGVPADQERFARALIDAGAVDLILGHSSHHPKGMELYHGRLILYGAGDLINDYEGFGTHPEFRPELGLLYLARLSRSGELESILLLPLRRERFRLNRATPEETGWLLDRCRRLSRGVAFRLRDDGLIVATPSR